MRTVCGPATSTSRTSRGHGARASKSARLRRLLPASSRAHAALPRRPGSFRDLPRACPRGALRRRSGAGVCGTGISPLPPQCGILAHGFARAFCDECQHDFLIAFSCKGRGVCPSCNTRRMVETAAHLTEHVMPRLPVRQWVLSVPKRLRYFLQTDAAVQTLALHLFLSTVERGLRRACPDTGPTSRIGAGSCGSIRLLRSLDQLTFAQFFAPPGIADLRMAACEISSPRARR